MRKRKETKLPEHFETERGYDSYEDDFEIKISQLSHLSSEITNVHDYESMCKLSSLILKYEYGCILFDAIGSVFKYTLSKAERSHFDLSIDVPLYFEQQLGWPQTLTKKELQPQKWFNVVNSGNLYDYCKILEAIAILAKLSIKYFINNDIKNYCDSLNPSLYDWISQIDLSKKEDELWFFSSFVYDKLTTALLISFLKEALIAQDFKAMSSFRFDLTSRKIEWISSLMKHYNYAVSLNVNCPGIDSPIQISLDRIISPGDIGITDDDLDDLDKALLD